MANLLAPGARRRPAGKRPCLTPPRCGCSRPLAGASRAFCCVVLLGLTSAWALDPGASTCARPQEPLPHVGGAPCGRPVRRVARRARAPLRRGARRSASTVQPHDHGRSSLRPRHAAEAEATRRQCRVVRRRRTVPSAPVAAVALPNARPSLAWTPSQPVRTLPALAARAADKAVHVDAARLIALSLSSQIDLHVDFEREVAPCLGRLIGVGGFGRVYAAVWRGQRVAVKVMPCDGPQHYQVRLDSCASLRHHAPGLHRGLAGPGRLGRGRARTPCMSSACQSWLHQM